MCLAIYKPAGEKVSKKRLRTAFNRNPHGAGFAYAKNDKVTVRKGYFTFDSFWKAYRKMSQQRAMIIHFRWATHGGKTANNCHPFQLTDKCAMIHNGQIHRIKVADDGSDTSNFCDRILRPIVKSHPKFIHTSHGKKVINLAIGESKVVVMSEDGKAVIFNEKKGHWDNGCWYSNESYVSYSTPKWSGKLKGTGKRKGKRKVKRTAHSSEILGTFTDYHATNRSRGRSYIDDLEEQMAKDKKDDYYTEELPMDFNPTLGEIADGEDSLDGFSLVEENSNG